MQIVPEIRSGKTMVNVFGGGRTGTWPTPWGEVFGVSSAATMAVRSLREGGLIGADDEAIVEAEA